MLAGTYEEGKTMSALSNPLTVMRHGRAGLLVFLALLLLSLSVPATGHTAGSWHPAPSMAKPRYGHTATLLPNGQVLVAGGDQTGPFGSPSINELYDPATGKWGTTGEMTTPWRLNHSATLLANGQVLVAGGRQTSWVSYPDKSAELYDPATGQWHPTGAMATGRENHSATLLPDGKVLVAGGGWGGHIDFYIVPTAKAEIYDPATGQWSPTEGMTAARAWHTATLVANGKVLVAGGNEGSGDMASAELYDPVTCRWSHTGAMVVAREFQRLTLLPNGKVFLAGGAYGWYGNPVSNALLYDPARGVWSTAPNMAVARVRHTATLLSNGQVLVAGGVDLSSAEIYNPATGKWRSTEAMTAARQGHTATLLPNGQVLVVGGYNPSSGCLSSAELYREVKRVPLELLL